MRRRLLLALALLVAPLATFVAGPSSAATVERLSGADRYATAAAVSAATFPTAGTEVAYVATGLTYADALAGAPAARKQGGPVLLSLSDRIPAPTANELTRLKPKRIVVLGGTGAINDKVAADLARYASTGTVARRSGADRYATAAAIATEAFAGPIPTAYVASGESYADALPGSAIGAASSSPVLLVGKGAIPESTASALRTLAPNDIVVLGGQGSIANEVEFALAQHARGQVIRYAGDDRFHTSAVMSGASFSAPRSTVFLTTGANFPDGLAGGVAAGVANGPLLLVRQDCMPESVKAELDRLQPQRVVVLGGTAAVSDATATGSSICAPPPPPPQPVRSYGRTEPVTAAFYYGWYPGNWFGITPRSQPELGKYSSVDPGVVERHINEMRHAGMQAAIASWWGRGHSTDRALPVELKHSEYTPFAWTVYYELEGPGYPNKSPAELRADLDYLWQYAQHPNWLRREGRPVVFVWPDDADGCAMAERWRQASAGDWYVVQKRFVGWTSCQTTADSWHEYGPGARRFDVRPWAFSVSPGFWHYNEPAPRLARDPAAFEQAVIQMKASGAHWQLVTTFNEWGEGTAIEPSTEWGLTYLSILNRHYGRR